MFRATFRIMILAVLAAAGSWGYWYFHNPGSLPMQIKKLEQEKKELQQIVQRLTDEKRVAQFIVLNQEKAKDGSIGSTTLLFEEHNAKGQTVLQKSFTIQGSEVHIDTLSIRFLDDYVMKGDAQKGHGLILFNRLYGAQQKAAEGFAIDDPGQPVGLYSRLPAGKALDSAEEKDLWRSFWRLVDDKEFRRDMGVKVASGKGVWDQTVEPGKLYTITLDPHANPTLDWEPIPPILREAMKRSETRPTVE